MTLTRPLLAAFTLIASLGVAAADVVATDILGREVHLPEPARHIVLGEGRHLSVLGLMHDDPVALVSGWRLDKALDEPTMQAYREKFPDIDQIRPVGSGNRDISAEAIIALHPDLVVLTLIDQNDPGMEVARQQIEAAGIPVAYVDFFSHPQENSIPSLRILGKLTGAEDRAEEFASFYDSRLARIRDRLAEPGIARPRVFFHVHAAPQNCCSTVGSGVFHDFITTAGGQNIGHDTVKGVLGNVSLEYLIGADPDVYIATGGTHMAARGGLVLGSGVDAETAQASFQRLIAASGFASLRAVEQGRTAGVWHLFNDSPVHIALIEYLAKTFHPELFQDVDPAATLAEINARFSPVIVPGTWWVTPEQ
ncbi:ABC transporter substrate-binding protein [Paracoccus sp. P2]|uniref:ABC transporter substrate-binding protein n=1 Tax=Paracoccus pantotrophus TaxID=82367 RepID=A0A1I5B690_PARPN|nr:ABC transporter substrate-binding protein [Paracoccus pantotrophus]MDF3852849.1 ABC transporter substrate-binding protein [Paracoccus pantotrophus]QFG36792.1 ABC transporter substrate-binding protein [Paracoccus pantotrophus]QLH14356.1 ABC transporter substrate-binding protein [Paracoccus pantotrophus]RDD96208.1 ABC transporter substrate-binding protein [Paracoccus pantotrophus]RKS52804.1 iron complex transport system substrate-binding protein [Paracoccus pantotrophus]